MKFGQATGAWTRVTDTCNRAIQILRGSDNGDPFTDWLEAERDYWRNPSPILMSPTDPPNKTMIQPAILKFDL